MSLHKSFLILVLIGSTLATQAIQYDWMSKQFKFDPITTNTEEYEMYLKASLNFEKELKIVLQKLDTDPKVDSYSLQDPQLQTQILLLQVLAFTPSQDA